MTASQIHTIGELKASGYHPGSVRDEMRRNLITRLREGKPLFPGIVGYDDTVIPQVENAILAGQDIVFLGERGQAKSRLMRSLVNLLDEEVPVMPGCEINDDPLAPLCKACREKVAREGDATPVAWLGRAERFGEKLATPDTTMADLIGDVDPIKVAEGRYLSDELTIHYGLIPRSHRGLFAINELPDLPERLQVGLFNLMEEADIQIRGYRIRLALDIYLVASANPEDYTSRGRMITPLKDRFGAQVRTHYPATAKEEAAIVEAERRKSPADIETYMPPYMQEIIAEFTQLARKSPDISQASGVSVRVSIANYESILANAVRRAVVLNETPAVPRISDLAAIYPSTTGKIELESVEDGREDKIIEELLKKAVLNVFSRHFQAEKLAAVVARFDEGLTVEASDSTEARYYMTVLKKAHGLEDFLKLLGPAEQPEAVASAVEFVLEGLYLSKKLSKVRSQRRSVYRT